MHALLPFHLGRVLLLTLNTMATTLIFVTKEEGRERILRPNSVFSEKVYIQPNSCVLFSPKLKDGCLSIDALPSSSKWSTETGEHYLSMCCLVQ
jgi:hypothetical protein